MRSHYASVLRTPGARAFVISGFVARLPMSMLGVGEVLLVQNATRSYATAGAVAASAQVASALAAPWIGRQTDRRGQRAVAGWQLLVHCIGVIGLILAAQARAPVSLMFSSALVAGLAYPAIGSLVRARWSALLSGNPALRTDLDTAFALEATLDELVFVIGPVLVTVLATQVHETAGLLAAVTLTAFGGAWFLSQRSSEPAPSGGMGPAPSVLLLPGVRVLAGAGVALAMGFAGIEVATIAFSDAHGTRAAAGPVLACLAAGSMIAGFASGGHRWRWTLPQRLSRGSRILAAASVPLLFVPSVPVLVIMVFALGLTVAPTLIALMGATERLVPATSLTEGFALIGTAIALGLSIGSLAAGWAAEHLGAQHAFVIPVLGWAMAALVTAGFTRVSLGD